MATVTINGRDVEIGDQEELNLIQVAGRIGVEVPHYCWHPALTVVASCRMCLVQVGDKRPDGTVAMSNKVVPACQTPARHGIVVLTDSPLARKAQANTLEFLLLNHPLDCPVCDQAGECFLQDYSYRYGRSQSRLRDEKLIKPDKDHIGEQIVLFTDRCVMCSRCVRFTREISGTAELQVVYRGDHSEIDVFPGRPCNNPLAGNVVDLCPVGALCSKDFLYKQRVWFLQSTRSVCPGCSTGCSINVDHNKGIIYRLRPRPNPLAQGYFMCDEGRYGFKYINHTSRLLYPLVRSNGEHVRVGWEELLPTLRRELTQRTARQPNAVALVISPWATCEEAFLFAKFFKGLSPEVRLALGAVRVEGADDQYPKGPRGEPPPADRVKFTIRGEKCPNRRGVEAILHHFQGGLIRFDQVLPEVYKGEIKTLYLVGGDPGRWLGQEQAETLRRLELLIVQDILPSPASALAKYVLPSGSFAEKDGTVVNHSGLAQALHRAIPPPGEARSDGRIAFDLLERRGLFHAPSIRAEMAREVATLAALAERELGEQGIKLDLQDAGTSGNGVAAK